MPEPTYNMRREWERLYRAVQEDERRERMERATLRTYDLPFPPSMNTYWRAYMGRNIISKRGRDYREAVEAVVLGNIQPALTQRLSCQIDLYPPCRRKRDIANYEKAAIDALVDAGAIEDDSLIDELHIRRCEVIGKPGRAVVTFRPSPSTPGG